MPCSQLKYLKTYGHRHEVRFSLHDNRAGGVQDRGDTEHGTGAGRLCDDRVMLQGFYWESHRHGHPDRFPRFGPKAWYEIVRDLATELRDARFDLVWLPPPSYAGDISAGYNPKEYFNLNNAYGDFDRHRAMLVALLSNGVEPVADIVINHRDPTHGWAGFENPRWGRAIANFW